MCSRKLEAEKVVDSIISWFRTSGEDIGCVLDPCFSVPCIGLIVSIFIISGIICDLQFLLLIIVYFGLISSIKVQCNLVQQVYGLLSSFLLKIAKQSHKGVFGSGLFNVLREYFVSVISSNMLLYVQNGLVSHNFYIC